MMAHRNDPSLEESIAAEATYHRARQGLRERVRASLANEPAPRRRWSPAPVFAFAAAFAAVAVLSWTVALRFAAPTEADAIVREVLDAHVRSLLLDNRLEDVASSDQHTVKPWFSGKLDFAPPVEDLASAGFVLAGGRLDFVDGRRVAALAYHYRKHVVNVFIWPAAGKAAPVEFTRQGYSLVSWRGGGMQYWAVSDAEAEQLLVLARAWPDTAR